MGVIANLQNVLSKYYEPDEVTDMLMRRHYLNTPFIAGFYPKISKMLTIPSVLIAFVHLTVSLFHLVVLARTCLVLSKLNFTLLMYDFQMYLLIQYCFFLLIIINFKRTNLRVLHRDMMEESFKYGEDHEEILDELHKEMWNEKKQLLLLPFVLSIVGGNAVLVGPYIDSVYGTLGFNVSDTNLNLDVPILIDYPFPDDGTPTFYFLSFLQVLTAIFVLSGIGSGSFIFINIVQHFTMHQKYLMITIKTIATRAEDLYRKVSQKTDFISEKNLFSDKLYQECYEKCLKKSFRHHQIIIKWFDSLNDLLSLPLGISYATGTVVIALSLLSLKTGTSLPGTAITSFMTCFLEVCFMALISVLGQRVADLNEDLRMAMYNINWYSSSNSVKSSIQIFQEMSLRPMQLTGFGLVKANLDTFSNVMNSAYSYYNLIMAV